MRLVCDASPLIVLAKARLLACLPQVASSIEVPQAVIAEVSAGPADDPLRRQLAGLPWLTVVELPTPISPVTTWQLGAGETEVIEWTRLHHDRTAVIDDHAGRRAAKILGLKVTGTLGIIALAAKQGVVPSFVSAVDQLRAAGLYVSTALVEDVARALES